MATSIQILEESIAKKIKNYQKHLGEWKFDDKHVDIWIKQFPVEEREIIEQRSPMTAKEISRKYDHLTRNDWASNRVQIMNWCIHLKLLYNWNKLGNLFQRTMDKEIVELSSKDDFWGALERGDYAEGYNVLGLLLKQVRKDYRLNQ